MLTCEREELTAPGWHTSASRAGDETSESRVSKCKSPLTWLSGPEWGTRPVLSALFGDMCKESGFTVLHVQLTSSERREDSPHPEATETMAISGAEILKYVSAMRLLDNQLEVKALPL